MANVVFLESGTSASQTTAFYSSFSATVPTSVTTPTFSGPRSLACDSTGSNTTCVALRTGVMADAGRRVSVYFRVSALPGTNANFISAVDSGNTTTIWRLQLQTNGKLRFVGTGNGTSGNTVLSANNWYRVVVANTITDSTHNSFKCWLQDVQAGGAIPAAAELTETNLTLAAAGQSRLQLGWTTAPGASIVVYFQHVYVDDGTDLADPASSGPPSNAPLLVTNKFANASAVYASNANYATRGTGAINEQPISTTNGQNITNNTATGEYSTAIQAADLGDADVIGATLIGSMGWLFCSGISTDQIVLLNTAATPTVAITSSSTVVFAPNTSSSYPQDSANRSIGIKRPTGNSTDSIYGDGGILIAYTSPLGRSLFGTPYGAGGQRQMQQLLAT